jgi:AbrB family looped-hinge helix DNA binding protein
MTKPKALRRSAASPPKKAGRERIHGPTRAQTERESAVGGASGNVKEWSTKVTSGGRVVLPAEARAALGLTDGSSVRIRLEDGHLVIVPFMEILRKIQEKWRRLIPEDRSMVDEFIAERRAEAERE